MYNMSYTESHIIQLSSIRATNKKNGTYLSDVEFSLPGLLKRNENITQKQISVLSAQIPMTIYATNSNNNILSIEIGASTFNTTITEGNYNANSLISEILLQLDNTHGITTFTITFSQITGKITFTNNVNFTLKSIANSILPTLGFASNTNYTSAGNTLTAPFPLNIAGALNFQISSHYLLTKNYNSIQSNQTTLLATIPINVSTWGICDYNNTTNIRNTLYNDIINSIDIQITDNLGNLVNFNNNDWEITLVLDITYNLVEPKLPIESLPLENKQIQSRASLGDNNPPIETEDLELYLLTN